MQKRDILELEINEMPGISFDCDCGRKHGVDIKKIEVGNNILGNLPKYIEEFKDKKILIVSDENTYEIAGKRVGETLEAANFKIKHHIAYTPNYPILVPDAFTVGRLFIDVEDDIGLILGVGSGTINDLCKIVSYKLKLESVIVVTAPSMDGYASTLSPLIVGKEKVTYPSHYPYAIIADIDIIKDAPLNMLQAGYGDIVGKYTALTDWRLTVLINDEYYCQKTVDLMSNALKKTVDNTEAYFKRDEKAIKNMVEALIIAGISMGLVGISRPASGSEHHLAHFWELDALAKGTDHPLHGISVGVGSIVTSQAYRIMGDRFPEIRNVNPPDPSFLREIYKKAGMALSPKELGISREVFKDSVNNAYRIRPRYTIFNYTKNKGMLPEIADLVTGIFYE